MPDDSEESGVSYETAPYVQPAALSPLKPEETSAMLILLGRGREARIGQPHRRHTEESECP